MTIIIPYDNCPEGFKKVIAYDVYQLIVRDATDGEELALELLLSRDVEDWTPLHISSWDSKSKRKFYTGVNQLLAKAMRVYEMRQVWMQEARRYANQTLEPEETKRKKLQTFDEKLDKTGDKQVKHMWVSAVLKGLSTGVDVAWTVMKPIFMTPVVGPLLSFAILHYLGIDRVVLGFMFRQLPQRMQDFLRFVHDMYQAVSNGQSVSEFLAQRAGVNSIGEGLLAGGRQDGLPRC